MIVTKPTVANLMDVLSPTAKLTVAVNMMKRESVRKQAELLQGIGAPSDWIQEHFYIPELKGAIKLYPYQVRCLNEALRKDDSGNFVYSIIVWSDIKKSAKSTIAAAVALYRIMQTEFGQFYSVANDLKQADSRVAYYFRRAIEMHPLLRSMVSQRGYRTTFPNNSYFEAIPIDPTGEAGGNADMVIFSELWGAHQEAQNRMWTEMTVAPNKFGRAFRWIETYAGFSGESLRLEELHRMGKVDGERLPFADEFDPPLEVYVNHKAKMFMLWNEVPRLPWQSPEYYEQQEQELSQNEFKRIHRNQWVSSEERFVPEEWWDNCQVNQLDEWKKNDELIVSADAGISSDNFGMIGVTVNDDNKPVVRFVRKWVPPQGGKITFSNAEDPDDMETPEGTIRWLNREYNLVEFAYDPYQLHDLSSRLKSGGINCREFSQREERLVADKQLYDLIRERGITHDGNDELKSHVMNANAKNEGGTDEKGKSKLRIVKRSTALKIDLCVSLSMACARALKLLMR